MRYEVLKIVKVSGHYYDFTLREKRWFREGKVLNNVRIRVRSRDTCGTRVNDDELVFNAGSVVKAYFTGGLSGIDFTLSNSFMLPEVHT